MIVPDEGKNKLLDIFTTDTIYVGLCIDSYPEDDDTWADHDWLEQEEQVTTVDSITEGVLTLTAKTFVNENDIKGFYVRLDTDLMFTSSLSDLSGTSIEITPVLGVTNQ